MNDMDSIWAEELDEKQARAIDPNQLTDAKLTEEQEIYKENILDHYRDPRNFGKRIACTFSHHENNPLCGDRIEMQVKLDDGKIKDITFNGRGCAVSQASASMLTEHVKGATLAEVQVLGRDDVTQMLGIPLGPVRLRCALLSLKVLLKGLERYAASETTQA